MFDRLLNQTAAPLLERSAAFHGRRHALLAENIVNLSTPGYVQRDLDASAFQGELRKRIAEKRYSPAGAVDLRDVQMHVARQAGGVMFHDGNNRSVEELMSDQAKNALQHNLAVELLRKQYALFDLALRERLG